MIVTCQKCRTKFRVRPEALKPQGTILRCSRCGSLFRTAPAQLTHRPGPPPGVSDEDYVLYGGPPPADRLRAPLEGAAPQEPVVVPEPKPAKAAAPTPPAVKTVAPQPVAAPPPAPEPVRRPALEAAPKPPLPEPPVQAPPLAPEPRTEKLTTRLPLELPIGISHDESEQISRAVGRWQRQNDPYVKEQRPYLVYRTMGDGLVRPEHAAWDNTVLPTDDPWWDTHYPPNDWGCRCDTVSTSRDELGEFGLKLAKEPPPGEPGPGWDFNPANDPIRWANLLLSRTAPSPQTEEPQFVSAAAEAAPEPAAPETAAKAPAVDEPWPEEAPSRAAPWPAAPLPPPPRSQAPTGLAALRRSLNQRSPLMMGVLAVTAVLVLGLFAYRTGLIGGERVDPEGKSRISFTGISGYFLKNEQDGIFYVVQGLVRNGYQDKRGRIRIKAAIHDATGRPVRQQMVYAGNVFSREELQRLPLQDIAARLAEPNQDLSAAIVRPGATVPFMAVFGDLPESLGEFSLEAASSSSSASS